MFNNLGFILLRYIELNGQAKKNVIIHKSKIGKLKKVESFKY